LTYRPFNGEADISFFNETMQQRGMRVAYPICFENGRMSAAVPNDTDAWEMGKYGIKTPVESRSLILSPLELTLVIVPCTVFNGRSKSRVGMGAGCYDRYLPECKNAALIAAAFEVQHMDAACSDPWDFPMDGIVTERSWY
jgi:5-formyltetrahydrofolate cyclo-ligase